jgi:hypothetical protein
MAGDRLPVVPGIPTRSWAGRVSAQPGSGLWRAPWLAGVSAQPGSDSSRPRGCRASGLLPGVKLRPHLLASGPRP